MLNCHKVMEDHPRSSSQLPQQIHNQQIRPGKAQSKCVQNTQKYKIHKKKNTKIQITKGNCVLNCQAVMGTNSKSAKN